ncbi:hypothetical protein NA78x_003791 [Anatilimnocola sp. NA78]|uniref:hypothetical protein n=1 Tax=Anatilimnocola sp. NA78 TaxID=3415683 RepID=UPI003CE4FFF9
MESAIVILAMLALVGAWLLICNLMGRCWKNAFEAKFPPITDDQFMARCQPGTSREVALKVRRIISEQLGVEYERIYPESSFVSDLDCG